jgi:hypothetical protein
LSPGRITAIYRKTQAGNPIIQDFKSATTYVNASDAYNEKKGKCRDWVVYPYSYQPTQGFQFVPGTAIFNMISRAENDYTIPHGYQDKKFTYQGPERIGLDVLLDACSGKHMGIVEFYVSAKEVKGTEIDSTTSKSIEIKWGESKLVPLRTDDGELFSITYTRFDGRNREISQIGDTSDKYVKFRNEGQALKVDAIDPEEVDRLRQVAFFKRK